VNDPIVIDLNEAEKRTPWKLSSLRRIARRPDSPFRKRQGKWVVVPADLEDWVRNGETHAAKSDPDPMPKPRRTAAKRGSFASLVEQQEEAA
jgi:hypothetical protein